MTKTTQTNDAIDFPFGEWDNEAWKQVDPMGNGGGGLAGGEEGRGIKEILRRDQKAQRG